MTPQEITALRARVRGEAAGLTPAEIEQRRHEAARTGCVPGAPDEDRETFGEWVHILFVTHPGNGMDVYDPARDPKPL